VGGSEFHVYDSVFKELFGGSERFCVELVNFLFDLGWRAEWRVCEGAKKLI
jgi:hypothetical protein